jgi:hypothetical protein
MAKVKHEAASAQPQIAGPDISLGVEVPLEAAVGQARPDLRPEPMFLLYWQPGEGAYSVRALSDGTPVLVPRIQILRGYPGVGGVDGADGVDFAKPAATIRKRGGIVLDAAACRAAKLPSYLRAHEVSRRDARGNATFHHLPPWRFPKRGRNGSWTIETDEDAKTRWEASLLVNGIIPAPEGEDLRVIVEGRANRIARHLGRRNAADAEALELERADQRRELDAIEAAGFVVDEFAPKTSYAPPAHRDLPEVREKLDA